MRNVPAFSTFLNAAGLCDAELVNFSNVARECGVSGPTVKAYFDIVVDTLVGRFLPGYTKRPKRRVIAAPKFYFADVGVAGHLARRGTVLHGGELYGRAFENWLFHELTAWNASTDQYANLSYWRLPSGIEVDFVVDDLRLAVEAKATERITNTHLRGLRELSRDHPETGHRVIVCLEPRPRRTDDGILVMPPADFCAALYGGAFASN